MVKRHLFAFITAISVCSTAFCSTHAKTEKTEKEIFDIVSAKLDKGGPYYTIQNNKYFYLYLENSMDGLKQTFASIPQNNSFGPIPPGQIINTLKSILNNSGIKNIRARGTSSVKIAPEKEDSLFHNKDFFYYGDTTPTGLFWTLFPDKNRKLTDLNRLPANTLYAFATDIYPDRTWQAIKGVLIQQPLPPLKMVPAIAEGQFLQKFKVQLPVVLKSLSGKWFCVACPTKTAKGQNGITIMLEAPAQDQSVFKLLKESLATVPAAVVGKDKISFKPSPKRPEWLNPEFYLKDKKICFVSSPTILKEVQSVGKGQNGLIKTAEFKPYLSKMPTEGLAFVYCSPDLSLHISNMLKDNIPFKRIQKFSIYKLFASINAAQFTITHRLQDGIMTESNSPNTIVSTDSLAPVAITAVMAGMLLPALNQAREKARRISCASNLKQIGLAMKQYAMDHKDYFPKADNCAGFNELIKNDYLTDGNVYKCPSSKILKANGQLTEANSSYIYFGGFKEFGNANTPLVFEKPGNHKGYVNILFMDGHVKGHVIPNYRNCTQIINHLSQGNNAYDPKLLKKLLEKAKKIDKEFGYK